MSGDLTGIIAALVVAPFAAGWLLIKGTIAVTEAVVKGVSLIHEAAKKRKQIKTDKLSKETESLFTAFEAAEEKAMEELVQTEQYIADAAKKQTEKMETILAGGEEDVVRFGERAETLAAEVLKNVEIQTENVIKKAEIESRAAFNKAMKLRSSQDKTLSDIEKLQISLQQKQDRIRALAQTAIRDAEAILAQLSPSSSDRNTFGNTLEQSKAYFKIENYTSAYTSASNLITFCAGALVDETIKANRAIVRCGFLKVRAEALLAAYEALEDAVVPYQGENYSVDLTQYYPDFFAAVKKTLDDVLKQLASLRDPDEVTVRDLRAKLDDVENDLSALREAALKRMYASEHEKEAADKIIDALEEQGFFFTDSAYEEDIEGHRVHINFEKKLTGEKITVVVDPETDPTRLGIRVLQFGDGSGEVDNARMKNVENVVMNAVHCGHSVCTRKGQLANDTAQSDLSKTAQKRAAETNAALNAQLQANLKC